MAQVENDKTDLFIFMGGNSGLNSLFVQPEIKSYEQLRGTTMAVDAPNTAFALLLYKMLDVKGIKRSDYKVQPVGATHLRLAAMLKDKTYSAAMLSPPGSIQAEKAGLKDLGSAVSVVGPYQSDGGWVLRSWGKANADTLTRYIQANVEGIRWALDPKNRAALIAVVAARLKLPPEVVAESLKLADDQKGFATDARFDTRRLPQRAAAARRHARHLGRQAAGAGQVSRSLVLRPRAEGAVTACGSACDARGFHVSNCGQSTRAWRDDPSIRGESAPPRQRHRQHPDQAGERGASARPSARSRATSSAAGLNVPALSQATTSAAVVACGSAVATAGSAASRD